MDILVPFIENPLDILIFGASNILTEDAAHRLESVQT